MGGMKQHVCGWNDRWWVFKVNCIKRLPCHPIHLGTVSNPALGRQARALDYEPLTATEPIVPEAELLPRIPKQGEPETIPTRFYIRQDVELQLYGYRRMHREGKVAKPHSLEFRDLIETSLLSEESDDVRRRYEESKQRRNAAGVPLEPRPGRVVDLPPGEVAGELSLLEQPRTETEMEEQASGTTGLPLIIAVENKQKSQKETEEPRDPRQTCQSW